MEKEVYDIAAPLIEQQEGRRKFPYTDTEGKLTIGIGRNLTDRGLSDCEINFLFANDLKIAEQDAIWVVGPLFYTLSAARKAVLIDMSLNLGRDRLSGFKNTLQAIRDGNYGQAAIGMRASKWAHQVGARAEVLAAMMEKG